jgi:hypothetical protein
MSMDTRGLTRPVPLRSAGRVLAALGFALLCAARAVAADYEIEVIVFRHVVADAGQWAASQPLPDFGAARRLEDAVATEGLLPPASFVRLPATMHRLAGAEKLLGRAGAYEVLSHAAWRQPDGAAAPVYLADSAPAAPAQPDGVGLPRPRAEGSVSLEIARPQLRVQTDFVVMAGETPVRVRDSRSLRPGELHYLDHALLGILLQVTEVLPPAGGEPADAGAAPLSD